MSPHPDHLTDREYMQRALRLADKGRFTTHPNPNVGCVIVNNNAVVGEGWHHRAGEAHAEVNALAQAGEAARGATAYVTLEPCSHTGRTPPCADALVKAGLGRVVIAMLDPNPLVSGKGAGILEQAGVAVETGLLESQARSLNPGFIKRMEAGRPYVRVKLAMSLDGRTAMASGDSKWITGEAARLDVQRLRAESSAILTGIDTVLADDPSMNVRLQIDEPGQQLGYEPGNESGTVQSLQDQNIHAGQENPSGQSTMRQPLRVVLDSSLRIADTGKTPKIATLAGDCLFLTAKKPVNSEAYPFKIEQLGTRDGHLDLDQVMALLAKREVNLLHVEAGSVLSGALLKHGLVDEIVVYMAPLIMGDEAKGLFHLPGLSSMNDRISLEISDIRMVGNDCRLTLTPANNGQ